MTSVAFYALGCKVNQAEINSLTREFENSGFTPVPFETEADVYVVNTCSVTHVGDAKSRQILRQIRRRSPDALIVATGCYASVNYDRLPIDGLLVVRNRDKDRLVSTVCQSLESPDRPSGDAAKQALQGLSPMPIDRRTRPMVKAQDGCDSTCSYCIIPRARGRSRSVDPEVVLGQIQRLVANGSREVVLTGVDLGSYGEDERGYPDLGGLLEMILSTTDADRVRVSSVEPGDFKTEWLELWADSRLCRHLHVPLQSGSDSVLARMRRKYDSATFAAMIVACRKAIPGLAITTDVMVGFPGETEQEYEEGRSFIESCCFDGLHVFPYSSRPGTGAAHLPNHVPEQLKHERALELRQLSQARKRSFVESNLGRRAEVLWEDSKDGVFRGITDNNLRVFSGDAGITANSIDSRQFVTPYSDGCWGEAVFSEAPEETLRLTPV